MRALIAAELFAQLDLGALQRLLARCRKLAAGPIDVERQHRQRRAIGTALAAAAAFRRALERARDPLWIAAREHALVEIERVAVLGHPRRPPAARPRAAAPACGRSPGT